MTVDSHQHFWKYNPAEYDWIDDSMSTLRRDFLPADLQPLVDAAISVQARQSIEETTWLLDLAEANDFLVGVVGWVPLVEPSVAVTLDLLAERKKLCGVRHIVQGEPDDRFLLREDFNRGIRAVTGADLTYDILIYERHLPVAIEFVDRHPNQRFVLDHIAKPNIRERLRDGVLSPWRENLGELARRENVWCKLSGVATEADHATWTEVQLRPYIDAALEAFGAKRIMFGSDWPVCLAALPYPAWTALVERAIGGFSADERASIMGGAATAAYKLQLR